MPDTGDLLNRRFEKASFGGYKASDVDSFMAELATTLSKSGREVTELKRRLEAAEKKLRDYEGEQESLKNTLLGAQRLADKIVKDAQEKAEILISDANIKSENLISGANIKSENLIKSAQSEIEMRKNEAERIKKEVSDFKFRVMRLYKSQLELIRDIPADGLPQRKDPLKQKQPLQQETAPIENEAVAVEKPEPEEQASEPLKTGPEQDVGVIPERPIAEVDPVTAAYADKIAEDKLKSLLSPKQTPVFPEQPKEKPIETVLPQKAEDTDLSEKEKDESDEQPQEAEQAEKEAAAAMQTVKLNLQFNEKTGEYEPIGIRSDDDFSDNGNDGDGIKFGSDYDLRTDSFDEEPGHRSFWKK